MILAFEQIFLARRGPAASLVRLNGGRLIRWRSVSSRPDASQHYSPCIEYCRALCVIAATPMGCLWPHWAGNDGRRRRPICKNGLSSVIPLPKLDSARTLLPCASSCDIRSVNSWQLFPQRRRREPGGNPGITTMKPLTPNGGRRGLLDSSKGESSSIF